MALLKVEVLQTVARVTLARPEVRNAFDERLIAELDAAFVGLSAREDVRCIVLAAEGPAFCAGADLNWMRRMADYSREENVADAGALARMLRTIASCPQPVVARVQGDVYAGGMGLVAACDIAVAIDSAGFCLSETRIGLVPATISPYVIRAIGRRAAQRYFLTAERFSAGEALRVGLVHQLVDSVEALDGCVDGIVKAVCQGSPAAVRAAKLLIDSVDGAVLDDALVALTVEGIADIRASAEGVEGVRAFLGKRAPGWVLG
ncbi:enoyl-CoA hydratase/isomerase family protein [Xylophilus rhododendri]|uniref:Enoyl-CoA hydratase/isomerase family protein n=1 Tax=Xylophilus rhododendri TaxID=2697032 RepID=A0A857J967_9BURK|nr:enoyl-CoA hydratase/isomerase family protein [Xylophilus rhododendri]QHI99305.1 enoyl-CoA hydratase/isomerase family protein [Xylophilus rhododendri]